MRRQLLHAIVFRNRQSRLWPPKNAVRRGITPSSVANGFNNIRVTALADLVKSTHDGDHDRSVSNNQQCGDGNINQNNNNVSI